MSPDPTSLSSLGSATRAVHVGNRPDETTGAVLQPLTLSTTFKQHTPNVPFNSAGWIYGRDGNPNRDSLETVLASLEHGHAAFATPSGTAATSLIVQALGANAHCLAIRGIYSGTEEYLLNIASDLQGWTTDFCPFETASDDEIYDAIRPNTKLIFLEAPTNPLISISDIANVCRIAKSHPSKPLVAVDNTFSSPYYSNPLLKGVDIVMHSTTKYLGGHSDLIGGVVVLREGLPELEKRMRWLQITAGSIPSPFDCYLLTRSIKTLSIRCLQHGLSALKIAAHLEKHPLVESIIYPGLKSHEHHQRARDSLAAGVWKDLRTRTGWEEHGVPFSGMLSFRIKGPDTAAAKFLTASNLFTLAESLGGVESLAKIPWLMSTSPLSDDERKASGLTPNLIRMSVGLEDVEDLLADIDQALEQAVKE